MTTIAPHPTPTAETGPDRSAPTVPPASTISPAVTPAVNAAVAPAVAGPARSAGPADRANRVTFRRLLSAEWLKFRTVRSNLLAMVGASGAAIGFGMLFASLAESGDGPGRLGADGLSLSLGGFDLAQLVIAILGVALVAGEYQTGMIRSWFAAAPGRLQVMAAKVGVYGAVTFVLTAVAAVVAFLAGQTVLTDSITALGLTDDGVLQALAGTALYTSAIAAMGVALGFILRSTAAGAGAVVGTLMLAPLMVSLLPASIADPLGRILPSAAGDAITGMAAPGADVLSTGWGLAVLGAWVAGTVGAAAVALRRRDA